MTTRAQLDQALTDSRQRIGLPGRYDLGILLVHGLGEQARGDTLTVQGDPLVAWLRGRVGSTGRDGDAKVDVVDAASRQQSTDAIPSAHAVIRITPPAAKGPPEVVSEPTFWVVAEAFWAENFRQATFNELVRWLFTVGPWVFATQVSAMTRRMEIGRHVPRWLRIGLIPITLVVGLAFVLLAAVAGFLMTVVAAAVFILAITNIPFLADAAKGAQRQLANGLGDAQVLSRSPMRFSAMAAEVRTGIHVLREQCSAVVVVAESQGTAVAWYGLKHEIMGGLAPIAKPEPVPPPDLAPIGLFLTHGQALRKLAFALHMARGGQTADQVWDALLSAGYVAAAVGAFLVGAPPLAVVALVLALVAEMRLLLLAKDAWDDSGADVAKDWEALLAAEATARAPQSGLLEWLDLWASADPAPVGPLGIKGERITSYKIRNRGSTLADHVSYWQNTTEFLPILASYLFQLGGPRQYGISLRDPRLEVPAMRRHARVLLLLVLRVFVMLGVLAGAIYTWLTPEFGRDVVAFIDSLDLLFVNGLINEQRELVVAVAGYVVILLAGGILWLVVNGTWNGLMVADEKTFFGGVSRPLWTWRWYLFGVLVVPIAFLVAGLLWREDQPTLAVGYVLAAIAVSLLCVTVLSGGGKTYGAPERLEGTKTATIRITNQRWSSWAIVLTLAALIVAVPIVAIPVGIRLDRPELLPGVLAIETVVISLVLALEGRREYRLFSRRFHRLNSRLPASNTNR